MRKRSALLALALLVITGAASVGSAASAANGGSFPAESFAWTVPAAGGSPVTGDLTLPGNAPLTNTTVAVDLAPLANIANVIVDNGTCPTAGTIVTCATGSKAIGDTDSDWVADVQLELTPLAGAVGGLVVKVPVTTDGDGLTPKTGYLTLTFAGHPLLATVFPNPPLGSGGSSGMQEQVSLGDHVTLAPIVTNAGPAAATNVVVTFELWHALAAEDYDNCVYAPYPQTEGEYVRCVVAGPLATGATGALTGFETVVPSDAPGWASARVVIDADTASPADPFPPSSTHFAARAASGHTVTLTSSNGGANPPAYDPSDIPADRSVGFYVFGGSQDLGVTPVTVHDALGSTAVADIVVTNHGPNEVDRNQDLQNTSAAGIEVHIPSWATATGVPVECRPSAIDQGPQPQPTMPSAPGYPYYYCASTVFALPVGSTVTFAFHLKITGTTGTDGSAWLWNVVSQANAANDTAPITLSITAGPTPSPTSSPTSGPSSGPSPSASATPAPTSGGGTGLPKTGSDFGVIAGSGAAIVLVGVGLLVLVRRRRA